MLKIENNTCVFSPSGALALRLLHSGLCHRHCISSAVIQKTFIILFGAIFLPPPLSVYAPWQDLLFGPTKLLAGQSVTAFPAPEPWPSHPSAVGKIA